MWRDPAQLLDMLIAARRVLQFTSGRSRLEFQANLQNWSATCYQMQIVGEAASKVSAEFQALHPEIPWRAIIGLRNQLVHNYGGLIADELWTIIERDVPALITLLELLVPPSPEDKNTEL